MSDGMSEYLKHRRQQREQHEINEVVRKCKLAICQVLKIDEHRVFSEEELRGMVKLPLMFGADEGVQCIEFDMYGDAIEETNGK